jgi:hypothetical protein
MLECLECGAGSTGSVMACARCGAPIAAQISVVADRAAGESADSAAPAGPGHQHPAKNRVQRASWWAIGGGAVIFLGSLLPWISVYVYDGNLFNASDDPNLFNAVAVGNSISGGARAASAAFGLIVIGLAIAILSASARGVFVKPQAYAYGIPLIALSVLGFLACGSFAVAGFLGFREAAGPGMVGYRIFTLQEKHPILAEDATAGSAHVSFTPNVGLIMILLGCTVAVIGAIRSLHCASPRPRRARHGETQTFHLRPVFHGFVGILGLVIAAFFLVFPIVGLFIPGFYNDFHAGDVWGILGAGAIVLGSAWMGIRQFRNGAKVSGHKLTIRNELRTYRVDAADIRAITLQPKSSQNGNYWVGRVELTSGKSIWIDNFDCGPAGKPPKPDRAAAVEEVRALLGVRADDIRQPGSQLSDAASFGNRSHSLRTVSVRAMRNVQDDDCASTHVDPVTNAPGTSAVCGKLPGILVLQRMAHTARVL